ncbi:hypothetical protein HE1_00918 [Holospora elegans E1]|uniref:Uncharacterized protein n=1 Tax=Holospora elegans E1 TaxID=1427503 RepID=A0A023DZP6_9PROT|nr:hypothetical protein [Holospora elegans]GAJ46583.1 hypothetical protein HE1_00918 [Holospora elegans E1]
MENLLKKLTVNPDYEGEDDRCRSEIITSSNADDCKQASLCVEEIDAKNLLANQGDDINQIVDEARKNNINPVISQWNTKRYL